MKVNYRTLAQDLHTTLDGLSQYLSRNKVIINRPVSRHVTAGNSHNGKTLLITPSEVNLHHGTGVLLNRILKPSEVINLRSHEFYLDKGPYTSHTIHAANGSRAAIIDSVFDALNGENIEHIICVPYFPEDFQIGLAARSILGVPLTLWVMDDTLIHHTHTSTSHQLAEELFDCAQVRFVISPEMRDAYEKTFERKFYILPPTAPDKLIAWSLQSPDYTTNLVSKTCAMVGNVWGKDSLRRLLSTVKASGWTVHWFGLASKSAAPYATEEELHQHRIIEKGFIPESELASQLEAYPFCIVPSGLADETDDRKAITLLSLPSRMPFLLSSAQIPMLVLGSTDSCSAQFATRFGVGISARYDAKAFSAAVTQLSDKSFNTQCRQNAAHYAAAFSDSGLLKWILKSSELGKAFDQRFEDLFIRQPGNLTPYIEEPAPKNIHGDFKLIYRAMHRIAKHKYRPDFVVDVGASSGIWSDTVQKIFPDARYVLVEPLQSQYPNWCHRLHPKFEWINSAASNKIGKASLQVSQDLYGSSLLQPEDHREYRTIEVTTTTLDAILRQKKLAGTGLLKIDVQFAEHLVIEGGMALLKQIDFLILELTLKRCVPQAKTFLEMVNRMEELGFHYFDDLGGWRNPVDGTLEQKDILFINVKTAARLKL